MSKKTFGFTLIEILVVATVIVLLASMGVASYKSINIKSRDAAVKQEMQDIKSAMESYRAFNGKYPDANIINNLLANNYLKKAPKYNYTFKSCSVDYLIFGKIEGVSTTITNTNCGTSMCNYVISQSGEKNVSSYSNSLLKCTVVTSLTYTP